MATTTETTSLDLYAECDHGSTFACCNVCRPIKRTDNVGAARRRDYAGYETKQEMIDRLCKHLPIGPYVVANGSTEPTALVNDVLTLFGIAVDYYSNRPDKMGAVVHLAGGFWDDTCHSRNTDSGGGSTVTAVGLTRFVDAAIDLYENYA